MAEALAERARQSRPDLRAARLDVEAAKAAKSLAAREGVPDVRIGASYGKEEDANVVLGTLSVPIPLFQRNQAARGEAAARIARAEATLEGFERQVREEVQLAVQHYKSASAAAKVYAGEVLAALQDNAALVNEAYRAGKVNLFELAFMRRETLEAQRSYIDVLEELAEARSELERAVGATP
ncbi:MAG TPA: TolC family protein [Polyangia bacterium]